MYGAEEGKVAARGVNNLTWSFYLKNNFNDEREDLMSADIEVASETGPVPTGFNWGAFLFTGIFLLCNRRIGTALLLMLGFGLLNALLGGGDGAGVAIGLISLVVSLYYGFAAKQIAWETGRYKSYAELQKSMRHWNIGALSVMGVAVVLIVLGSLGG